MIPHKIRSGSESDIPFVYNSWLKSYRKAHMNFLIPSDYYYQFYQAKVAKILRDCKVIVCHNPEDPEHIYGFLAYQVTDIDLYIAHYCYIKQPMRELGLFESMLKHAFPNLHKQEILATAMTKCVNYPKYKMIFNPYWESK